MKVEKAVSRTLEIYLRIFGIWPNTSGILLLRVFWTVMIAFEQIFQYRYIVMRYHSIDFSKVIDVLSAAMTYTIFSFKLVIFWYKQRTLSRILTMMAIDWEKCTRTKFSMFATTCNAKLSQRLVNMTVIIYSGTVIFYSIGVIFQQTNNDSATNGTKQFILDMDLPFDANQRFIYESVIVVQFIHLLLCADGMGLLNIVLINLVLHISGQIDILRNSLMEVFPKKKKRSPSRFTIKEIIKKHQEIIAFSEQVEDLYSYIAMVLFVTDTLIICGLGFTIVASIGEPNASKNIIRNIMFYFVMNMEAFIYCFAGEYLSVKSKSIGDAAYDSLWYESDCKDNQIVLLLIMRSQNQLVITIGKVMNLSLERFSSVSLFETCSAKHL
ncbi:hypothetical protein PUN28_001134 [Cardiocondyla obscurior]|uniref:Odorant receptor n=1 Tax=Cardiocondyla obscurior TaxID=286306 RepID=A0AAW2H3V1_9HYME